MSKYESYTIEERNAEGLLVRVIATCSTEHAPLLAAAPDLLEAARRALEMMGEIKIPSVGTRVGFCANVTRAALAAAIRRAEGEAT